MYKLEGEILEEIKAKLEIADAISETISNLEDEYKFQKTLRDAEKAKLWNYIAQHYPQTKKLSCEIDKQNWNLIVGKKDDRDFKSFIHGLFGQ